MLKKTLLAVSATAAALVSTSVLADPPRWAPAHGYRSKHQQQHHHYRYHHYQAPRRIVVVPAPRVVYAAPVVVRPAPVYGAPSLSIRFNIPL